MFWKNPASQQFCIARNVSACESWQRHPCSFGPLWYLYVLPSTRCYTHVIRYWKYSALAKPRSQNERYARYACTLYAHEICTFCLRLELFCPASSWRDGCRRLISVSMQGLAIKQFFCLSSKSRLVRIVSHALTGASSKSLLMEQLHPAIQFLRFLKSLTPPGPKTAFNACHGSFISRMSAARRSVQAREILELFECGNHVTCLILFDPFHSFPTLGGARSVGCPRQRRAWLFGPEGAWRPPWTPSPGGKLILRCIPQQ